MRLILLFMLISSFFSLLAGCENREEKNELNQPPATLVKVPGSQFNHVILSQEAADRIGIELVPLKELPRQSSNTSLPILSAPSTQQVSGSSTQQVPQSVTAMAKQIPYSAIIYGLHGETWVYTLIKPLTFMRTPVVIDHIDGDLVVLSEGPMPNTQIVSVGATELYGAEYIGNIEP